MVIGCFGFGIFNLFGLGSVKRIILEVFLNCKIIYFCNNKIILLFFF